MFNLFDDYIFCLIIIENFNNSPRHSRISPLKDA